MNYFAACPEFACDDQSDIAAPIVDDIHPMMLPIVKQCQRMRGIVGPEVGGMLDVGFLLACDESFRALTRSPSVFADLIAWRMGASVADQHGRGGVQRVAADQVAAQRNRRHREYRDGLRVRPLTETTVR